MTTARKFIKHIFGGGWATDFGPNANVEVSRNGEAIVPFMVDAENCIFELDGGPHKVGGASKVNSSALESGADIRGIYDMWISGSGGSSTQHRILYVNTKLKKDDLGDGSFSDIKTGLEADKVASFNMFEDKVIWASTSSSDVPQSWDGSTMQNLAGSPPNFAFSTNHKNRVWAAGVVANPSRLYYCNYLDEEDWTGSGSGHIDIDPSDGDRITGLISHRGELWVFKGPYKGSIHRIAGSAPTGSDPFRRSPFVSGVGAVAHNAIFEFRNDVGFLWNDGTVRSLSATADFGDFKSSALTVPINTWLEDHVNFSVLTEAQVAVNDTRGYALITLPIDSSTTNNVILMMNYNFSPVRWAKWTAFDSISLASVVDPGNSSKTIIMAGGGDGFVRKMGEADRSVDGTSAITITGTTPFLDYGDPIANKMIMVGSLGVAPKNSGNITFGWQRDNNAQQTVAISQGGSDVLGTASSGQFTLGTSTLGGSRFVDRFYELEEGGEFRAIQYSFTNAVNYEDVEVHSIGAAIHGSSWSTEN